MPACFILMMRHTAVFLGIFLLVITEAQAGKWDLGASVNISEQYSNNVRGVATGGNRQGSLITGVSPGITAERRGSRLGVQLSSQLQYRNYLGADVDDTVYPGLAASADFEAVKNRLFFDASTRFGQQVSDPAGSLTFGNSLATGNRSNYQVYSAGSRWQQKYRRFATSEVDYRIDRSSNQSGLYSSYQSQLISASLNNGPSFRNIIWNFQYSNSKTDYQGRVGPQYESLSATLGYRFSRKFSLSYTMGEENNTLVSQGVSSRRKYTYWYLSANYNPTVRTQIQASYGNRFFGETYSLSLSHSARRSSWSLSYNEDISTRSIYEQQERALLLVDENGQLLLDPPTGLPLVLIGQFPVLVDDSYISRSFNFSNSLQSRRTTITTGLTYTQREYLRAQQGNDQRYSVQLGWNVNLNARADVNFDISWQRYEIPLIQQNNDIWLAGSSYSHTLDRQTQFSLSARYYKRQADVASQRQTGFSLYASLNFTL